VIVEDVEEDVYLPFIKPEMIDGSTQVIIDKQDAQITAKPISTSIEVSASPELTNQEVQNVPVYQD